jgi:hypothetical protein
VDFAEAQPETDPDAISLMGIGLGGYLAPRACAFEHRIKSCIADGGIYDYHEVAMRNLPSNAESMLDDPAGSLQLDDVIYGLMKADALIRRVFNDGMWKFGAASPSDWLRETRQYTLKDCIDKIKCRMLVVDSENDPEFRGQALALFEALKSPKEYICFTAREGAEEHCQAGAPMISNERIFDWLDATLGGVRQPSIREKVVI